MANLPKSEVELKRLAEESPSLSLEYGDDVRLFPNISFSCSGSVVGWSLIAPQVHRRRGSRPIMNVWSPEENSTGVYTQLRENSSVLEPCFIKVLNGSSEERELYLYESITSEPLEFKPGDIIGLVLHDPDLRNSVLTPYMVTQSSIVSYYRSMANNAVLREDTRQFQNDSMVPLLFLHTCKA